jgi:hypothetical protein
MNMELKYRKELLIRKNRCREFYEKYLKKIDDLLLIDTEGIKFLSLEESDFIKTQEISNEIYTKKYNAFEKGDLIRQLKENQGSYYIFIDHDWEYCGCFQVYNLKTINDSFAFGNYITDDIVFIENSFSSKIRLDYYEMNNLFYIDYDIYRR